MPSEWQDRHLLVCLFFVEEIIFTKARLNSTFCASFGVVLFYFVFVSSPTQYDVARYSLFVLKVPLNTNQPGMLA